MTESDPAAELNVHVHHSIDEIKAVDWNALRSSNDPFVRHEFLAALEHHQCVGEKFGWLPHHLSAWDTSGTLLGAIPMYLKDNSYGEFVFDSAWADAYHQNGLHYYPKLVVAVPYTPATGPRLLLAPETNSAKVAEHLICASLQHAKALKVSSLHWLFAQWDQLAKLEARHLLRRTGCQYHWSNDNYSNFNDFLSTLTSKKRKKIKRERRQAVESQLNFEIVLGDQASEDQLVAISRFYRATFDRKWGTATLNLGFFKEIARRMGEQMVLFMARDDQQYVAAAICFQSDTTLYGRHWGCDQHHRSLHFELCYYQGIEYCIQHRLQRFEPGAQGEHKVWRGFVPTPTYSAHWIAHEGFRQAIGQFLSQETLGMQNYFEVMKEHSPFKDAP